jgi:protein-disulfide isomerase
LASVDTGKESSSSSVRPLAILVGLGALNALWSLFLWAELLLTRMGQKAFCALGEGADCGSLWDGAFASAIHASTGLPIAGWGLAFSVVSIALPLIALERMASTKSAPALLTSTRFIAIAGLGGTVILVAAAAAAGIFCLGCTVTYVLTAVYGGVALVMLPRGMSEVPKAAGTVVLAMAAAFLVLLYPGTKTPKSAAKAEKDAMTQAMQQQPSTTKGPNAQAQQPPDPTMPMTMPGTPEAIQRARAFIAGLPPEMKQALSDSLEIYRHAPTIPVRTPRAVVGDPSSPVRITDFTDAKCGHCAQLHATIAEIVKAVPPGSFHVEPRHFPLDKGCNPQVQRDAPDKASCIAAKLQVCLEGNPRAFEFSGALFENGRDLTVDKVWQIASAYGARADLEKCVNDPGTQRAIDDDIAWAMEHELEGTPLVLINGKKGTSFGPFVFSMILAGGDAQSPIFEGLPTPQKGAHIH